MSLDDSAQSPRRRGIVTDAPYYTIMKGFFTMDENEIVVEELDDEVEVETPKAEPERDNTLETILGEFARMNERINELEHKVDEMLAPIRNFAQKDLPQANTSEESAPALYYL